MLLNTLPYQFPVLFDGMTMIYRISLWDPIKYRIYNIHAVSVPNIHSADTAGISKYQAPAWKEQHYEYISLNNNSSYSEA